MFADVGTGGMKFIDRTDRKGQVRKELLAVGHGGKYCDRRTEFLLQRLTERNRRNFFTRT